MNTESEAPIVSPKSLGRGCAVVITFACLLVTAFIAGLMVGSHPNPIRQFVLELLPFQLSSYQTEPRSPQITMERDNPGALLRRLDVQIRMLQTRQETLKRVAKENEIQYSLLRNRGYQETSPECLEILRRQKAVRMEQSEVADSIDAGCDMETRLIESINRTNPDKIATDIPRELRRSIEHHLNRLGAHGVDNPAIPDELWESQADSVMRFGEWSRLSARSTSERRTMKTANTIIKSLSQTAQAIMQRRDIVLDSQLLTVELDSLGLPSADLKRIHGALSEGRAGEQAPDIRPWLGVPTEDGESEGGQR